MLVRFANAEVSSKTKIADQAIEDIGEMVAKSDPIFGTASSFEEERRVRQNVGDAALFFSGLYPGSVHYRQRHQQTVQTTDELVSNRYALTKRSRRAIARRQDAASR